MNIIFGIAVFGITGACNAVLLSIFCRPAASAFYCPMRVNDDESNVICILKCKVVPF